MLGDARPPLLRRHAARISIPPLQLPSCMREQGRVARGAWLAPARDMACPGQHGLEERARYAGAAI